MRRAIFILGSLIWPILLVNAFLWFSIHWLIDMSRQVDTLSSFSTEEFFFMVVILLPVVNNKTHFSSAMAKN